MSEVVATLTDVVAKLEDVVAKLGDVVAKLGDVRCQDKTYFWGIFIEGLNLGHILLTLNLEQ